MEDEIDYKTCYETAMIGFKMQMQEIERLNNIIKTKDEGIKAFTEDLCNTTLELEKTKSILKEVREYIYNKEIDTLHFNSKDFLDTSIATEILEILDKGE